MKVYLSSKPALLSSILFVIAFALTACGGGSGGGAAPTRDTTPPVITLIGDNPQSISIATAYTELGATAQDNVDGDISSSITIDASAVDTSTVGSYTVSYKVTDVAGNAATTQTRTVNVEADATLPASSIGFPTKTGLTDAESITVRGTASDASGVASVEVNGIAAVSNDGFANWWVDLPLTAGNNPVSLKVTDTVGNQFEDAAALNIERNILWDTPTNMVLDSANNRLLVVESALDSGLSALIAVDLTNGNRTPVSDSNTGTGTNFSVPFGITLDSANNRVLVMDFGLAALFAVDLANGNRTVVSDSSTGTGINFSRPFGIALDSANSRVLVVDSDLGLGSSALIAVDLTNGNRTIFSDSSTGTGAAFSDNVRGIAIDSVNNRVLVMDTAFGDSSALVAVDLANGNRTAVSDFITGTGVSFENPENIALDSANNRVLVVNTSSDPGVTALIAVDLTNGNRTIVSDFTTGTGSGDQFSSGIQGIVLDSVNNRVLVTDSSVFRYIIAVDLTNGNRTIFSDSSTGTGLDLFLVTNGIGIALDSANNRVLMINEGWGALIGVDLANGNRTIVSSGNGGPNFRRGGGIALDSANNRVLVTDENVDALLIAVDLASGNRTIVSDSSTGTGTNFGSPQGIALDSANNRVLVVDDVLDALIAVDLANGNRTIVSDSITGTGANFGNPHGIALDSANDRMLVTDENVGALIAVDLASGNRTIVSDSIAGTGANFGSPQAIALDSTNNRVLVVDVVLDALIAVDSKPNPNLNSAASGDRIVLSK